jgi:hypothetical protein
MERERERERETERDEGKKRDQIDFRVKENYACFLGYTCMCVLVSKGKLAS